MPKAKNTKNTNNTQSVETAAGEPQTVRRAGWSWRHPAGCYGVLHIRSAGVENEYFVQRMSSMNSEIFQLTKLEECRTTVYVVTIRRGKLDSICGCPGWENRKVCKHIEALLALREQGKLVL